MEVIYSQGAAANPLFTAQKRTLRAAYSQTQGFPYACFLDPSLRNSDNSIRIPQASDTAGNAAGQGNVPLTRTANAFTYENSLVPGTVMVRSGNSEYACVANGATGSAVHPWGLLGQWVGGSFDGIGLNNSISVWMGPDSTYDLLAPAWNDTGLAAALASATAGQDVYLYAGTDGRLTYLSAPGSAVPVCRVIERWDAARLTIQLVI